ncbi:MAG: N-acetylmuramoyl-L-alanine amidase [Pseudomonadota bacterium]|nr:N-acetylmuramoyl-L-alanine amidase [Pseudomonadota bacterium]
MNIHEHPSPNFNARPARAQADIVILHYTGMHSAEAALHRMCDPAAEVSAHYMINDNGTVFRLVAEENRAWHAGVSYWQGATNINDRSIGIEIVNPGHDLGYRPFSDAQMLSLKVLLRNIIQRHGIVPARVLGHSDVAPARKKDPGELFDWKALAAAGLAIWPHSVADPINPGAVAKTLCDIGYDPTARVAETVVAFQRRFMPQSVTGNADLDTRALISAVASIKS